MYATQQNRFLTMHTHNEPPFSIIRMQGKWSESVRGYKKKLALFITTALENSDAQGLSIVLADDAFVQKLNQRFRGKDTPTNVLSFAGSHGEMGDIVLAFETLKREAAEQHKRFTAHLAHLVIHGILHLRGFDHETEGEASIMEQKEIVLLKSLGFSNPYTLQ